MTATPPILAFTAFSGSGKTTLLKQLIPRLRGAGIRVALLKHAHHAFDVDIPGKDSYELRKAGADQVLVASNQRWALMVEQTWPEEADPLALIERFDHSCLDLILVEGFKHYPFAKIALHREASGHAFSPPTDRSVIALASDLEPPPQLPIPHLDLNDIAAVAAFVEQWLSQQPSTQ